MFYFLEETIDDDDAHDEDEEEDPEGAEGAEGGEDDEEESGSETEEGDEGEEEENNEENEEEGREDEELTASQKNDPDYEEKVIKIKRDKIAKRDGACVFSCERDNSKILSILACKRPTKDDPCCHEDQEKSRCCVIPAYGANRGRVR